MMIINDVFVVTVPIINVKAAEKVLSLYNMQYDFKKIKTISCIENHFFSGFLRGGRGCS